MKKSSVVCTLSCLSILGVGLGVGPTAQAAPQVQSPTETKTAATSRGLWLEFKIGSSVGYAGNMVVLGTSPGFLIGYKMGRFTMAAEVGVGYSGSESDASSVGFEYRSVGFTVVPQLQYNVLQRGPFALYVVGGAGMSMGWSSYPSADDTKSRSLGVLVHLGFGVRYFVHPRFALGLEVAADGRWNRTKREYAGTTEESRNWAIGARGAFTAAVVF